MNATGLSWICDAAVHALAAGDRRVSSKRARLDSCCLRVVAQKRRVSEQRVRLCLLCWTCNPGEV